MAEIIILLFGIILVRWFLDRNRAQPGGRLGPVRVLDPPVPPPAGFLRVYARTITVFTGSSEAGPFRSLNAFLRRGTGRLAVSMRVYRIAGSATDIEIPEQKPDYDRLDATEALGLLRELPDLRFVRRLQLSDLPCYLDPWLRAAHGPQFLLLGNATKTGVVVLYRPRRGDSNTVSLTLLHEWLHLVAFHSPRDLRRFERAGAIEPLIPLAMPTVSIRVRRTPVHEAWADLGERLFGHDETIAREAANAAPVHAKILWQRVEHALRQAPADLRSTRVAELEARGRLITDAEILKGAP